MKEIKNSKNVVAAKITADGHVIVGNNNKINVYFETAPKKELVTSIRQAEWLKEYAKKLETRFFNHLCQQEQPDHSHTQYLDMLVRERPANKGWDSQSDLESYALSDLAVQPDLRALVLGGGGSGKTTLLRKLALECCHLAINDAQAPLPFFARLNFFDAHTDVLNGLLDVVAEEANLSRDELFHLWSGGSRRCIFILDGLNEVPPDFINDCCQALQRLTEQTPHTYLISSRQSDHAIELQRQLGTILEVEVLQLDTEQVKIYLERAGVGDLYNRMDERLFSLSKNPFLLWAIVKSCVDLPGYELPKTIGQLYENLIDGYIFGKREVSKPQASRPTSYDYTLVKKPVLARLAVKMCQQGLTRILEENVIISIRDHLYELRDSNMGIRQLHPHKFMPPEPFANDLLDECVANGILQRAGSTLEFMHESVRDYFAAVDIFKWDTEQVLQAIPQLIWRQIEPEYHSLRLSGALDQAIIMTSGLHTDAGNLLRQLVNHHPLLAAHCLGAARGITPEIRQYLISRWTSLLDRRLTRYRWVGCQCIDAAKVSSEELANRMFEVIRSDPEWQVRKSAARAFAAINDTQMTKMLVAQAINEIPESDYGEDNLGYQFRYLQSDTLILELLLAWGDVNQTDARKRRIEQLFALMRKSSLRQRLQRLAEQPVSVRPNNVGAPQLAQAALGALDTWNARVIIPHSEDLHDLGTQYDLEFKNERSRLAEDMSTQSDKEIISALKDSSAAKRASAACCIAIRKMGGITEMIEAFACERNDIVTQDLLEALKLIDNPQVLFEEWQKRICDQRWTLLFSVAPESANDLEAGILSDRLINEFKQHNTELKEHQYIVPRENGWMILPGPYGGKIHHNSVYWLQPRKGKVEVFDAGMRPRLVALAEAIGTPAIPVLKELLSENNGFLQIEVVEVLGKIASPEVIALQTKCLEHTDTWDVAVAAIEGLEKTQSTQAVQPLIEALLNVGSRYRLGDKIGHAIGALDGVATLIKFASETGMHRDDHCRLATILALGACGGQGSDIEELLLIGAKDSELSIREAAVAGLASIKSSNAEQALLSICLEDDDEGIRAKSGEALRHFQGDSGVARLVAVLESENEELRIRAAQALARIQDDSAIPALKRLVESDASFLRIAAAKALNELGFDQVEMLIQVLYDLACTAQEVEARQEAAKAMQEIPGGEERLYQPIKEALTKGQYNEVIQLIGTDSPLLKDDANLYWWRGLARHYLKRNQDALTDLDQAISIVECRAVVYTTRAKVLAALNRYQEATEAAEVAIKIEAEDAMNHFCLGWCAYLSRELEKSITASRRALNLNPKLALAAFNLGLALMASEQEQEAISVYDRGIAICTELNQEEALTNFDDALEDLNNLLPNYPQAEKSATLVITRIEQAREAKIRLDQ